MYIDKEYEKRKQEDEKKMNLMIKKAYEEKIKHNNEILKIPNYLNNEEKKVYERIINDIKQDICYYLSKTDVELIWQYCQMEIIRDRAWKEYNKNPDRYTRIVTGICSDGKTPKVIVKENEYYKTLQDCNKHLEKILKDLRLTPEKRKR